MPSDSQRTQEIFKKYQTQTDWKDSNILPRSFKMHIIAIATSFLLALCASHTVASATPSSLKDIRRRDDSPKHCVDDAVDGPKTTGNLYCVGSDGFTLTCDECLGNDGNDPATAAGGTVCYLTTGGEDLGNLTACPGDPAPKKLPDGSDSNLAEDLVDAWCTTAGALDIGGFLTFASCYGFALAEAAGDPYEQIKVGIECKSTLVRRIFFGQQ